MYNYEQYQCDYRACISKEKYSDGAADYAD